MEKISNEQFFAEFDQALRSMPNRQTLHHDRSDNHEWLGGVAGLVMLADPIRGIIFKGDVDKLYSIVNNPNEISQKILVTLQQLRTEYRLKSGGPLTVAFSAGRPFDYFDEVRKLLEVATSEVFVVDPYLGAEFVSRYLPYVKSGVKVRLLIENQVTQVKPAVELFRQQNSLVIELRKSKGLHDRYIFIDKTECFHSGATFKDGAAKSATTLTQITDAFAPVLAIYEAAWASGSQ